MKIVYKKGKKINNKLTKKEKKEITRLLEPFYKLIEKKKK